MIDKAYIQKLVEEITEGTSIFLTKLDIDNLGKISVYLDSDTNLTIDDCVKVSRYIEKNLSLSKDDYQLDVSSHGIGNPLTNTRQYPKHIGHFLQIKTIDNQTIKCKLINYESEKLTIEIQNKNIKKEKEEKIIDLSQIKECKEILKL